jgi:hypothetical protein
MLYAIIAAQIALTIIICGFVLWSNRLFTKLIIGSIQSGLSQLDSTIAEAIQEVINANLQGFEPPNPLVAILTEAFKDRLTPDQNITDVTPRNVEGKFTKLTDTSL